jgi:hypothetical protein
MPDLTPSRVFPLPGYTGTIAPHGAPDLVGGSDIFATVGTPIVSVASGTVDFISTQSTAPNSGGNAIGIKGLDGLNYYYAHMLNAPALVQGQQVLAGQQLGQVDNSGNAKTTPSHLHIGIGYGITEGTGPPAGIGKNFDAIAMLKALQLSPSSNDPQLVGKDPNPPQIQFVPSVPGFDSGHADDILLNLQKAIEANIDPFLWLGIVSKESNFDPNAKNKVSGACGYAQIYPCLPNLSPAQNIDEGIKRLKGFLDTCNGNVNCALNLYSGGGGPLYASDVQQRATAIKTANPTVAKGGFSIPTIGGSVGTPGASTTPINKEPCDPIKMNIAGNEIPFPDVPCLIRTTISNMVAQLTSWWRQWQTQHIPNWFFVGIGLILILFGAFAIASQSGALEQATTVAKVAAVV